MRSTFSNSHIVPYAEKNTGVKRYIAEALGTFALVFCGTGAIVVEVTGGTITHVGVAITFGLIVMAMISPSAINPARTSTRL